ncbi:MAG TPA: hypothetical protein VGF46_01870 [Gaiellales bacterium]|jgi:hypothetical protein
MLEATPQMTGERCQARPAAARPGYREDMLCASLANTHVTYREANVPVCRMHAATYARWAGDAEANAEARWDWRPSRQSGLGERPIASVASVPLEKMP